ncbi:MAG: putative ribose-phosphate pyrophosphokinase [Prokaryotic dsDNA virus sp.]|nr:MAG: putative ribose-phosphate pyrophosphokinase [Prokaryotic dsDNA virus sp.]|tara:strand:- start:5025 stop:5894 length:870 start_codon:yes stop_codon:yes gene_type:complete
MTIQVIGDNKEISTKFIEFSDGGFNIQIDKEALENLENYVCLTISPDTPVASYSNIIEVVDEILVKANISSTVERKLNLPYFPHARADRPFEEGMVAPLQVFIQCLWTTSFDKILCKDLHSDVVKEDVMVRNMIEEISQYDCLLNTCRRNESLSDLIKKESCLFVAPDKGAVDKTLQNGFVFQVPVTFCEKERDVSTGWITGFKLESPEIVLGKDILITDDICDGGMTFLKCAEALKEAGANSVSLYVTHGIFSKGLDIFKGLVDNIYCEQTVANYISLKDIDDFNGGE